ncbi:hypothetical protein C6A85_19280, partial [Mycobacterium sp. ITM-2017-0098]
TDVVSQRDSAQSEAPEVAAQRGSSPRKLWRTWKTAAAVVALLGAAAMVAVGGLLMWQHQKLLDDERNRAEFSAAARQAVVTLMS